jgi:hypothetical protein
MVEMLKPNRDFSNIFPHFICVAELIVVLCQVCTDDNPVVIEIRVLVRCNLKLLRSFRPVLVQRVNIHGRLTLGLELDDRTIDDIAPDRLELILFVWRIEGMSVERAQKC